MNTLFRTILRNRPLAVVVFGFGFTIATFIGNILLTYNITRNLRGNVDKVEALYGELSLIAQIETEISFAENTLKNYLISNQVIYLRSHERALSRLEDHINTLSREIKTSNTSEFTLAQLTKSIGERKVIFKRTRELRNRKPENLEILSRELLAQGSDKTLEIREILKKLESELRISLEINRKYINRSISYGSYTNYLAIGIALVVAFLSTFSIAQDYLRQKEIERILRQLNDDKTRLFSILGHDLRSPLSGLNAIIYILKNHRQSLSQAEIGEYVDQLEQSALNYGKLLEDVLTWSRLQLNKIQILPQPHALKLLCQEVILMLQDQLSAKKIRVLNLIPSDRVLEVDKTMLQTVFRNLISNAMKFSFPGGEIRVQYREDADYYFIDVQDFGVGMSPAILKTLFTTSSISLAGTENEMGTGLGLSICKEFLSKQDGDLLVSSAENEGSTFSIALPKEETRKKLARSRRLLPKTEQ